MDVGRRSASPIVSPAPGRLSSQFALQLAAEDGPDEGVAVAVRTTGGEPDDGVTRPDALAGEHGPLLDHADREACQVIFAAWIEAGHLGRLSSHQAATGLAAALGDPLDDLHRGLHVEDADRQVVEEEEGFGAVGEDVVDAHSHQVDADAAVAAHGLGQAQLGADTVRPRHQDRVAVAGEVEPEEGPESSQPVEPLGPSGRLCGRPDAFNEGCSLVDVDARLAVVHRSLRVPSAAE